MSSITTNPAPNEQLPLLNSRKEFPGQEGNQNVAIRPDAFELVPMNKGNTQEPTMETKSTLRMKRQVDLPTIDMPERDQLTYQLKTPTSISPIGVSLKHSMAGQPPVVVNYNERIAITVFLPVFPSEEEELTKKDEEKCGIKMSIPGGKAAQVQYLLAEMAARYGLERQCNVFSLWMVSPLLEFQLKPHHRPWQIFSHWQSLLADHASDATETDRNKDMPVLYLKRNIQLSKEDELAHITFYSEGLDILYNDARSTLFNDRYRLSQEHAATLAGLGFAIETKDFDPKIHTPEYIRKNLEAQLPDSLADAIRGPLLFGKSLARATSSNSKNLEKIYETWKRCAERKDSKDEGKSELKQEYLTILREHSFQYGAAVFRGRIERPSASPLRDLKRFFQNVTSSSELEVEISVNLEYISVVDNERKELLLAQRIVDCSWRKIDQKVSEESNETRSVLLLHFPDDSSSTENLNEGKKSRTSLLQIFGPQVSLLEAMLKAMKTLNCGSQPNSASSINSGASSAVYRSQSSVTSRESTARVPVTRTPSLTKNTRMCLANFENGVYIGAKGSLKRIDWTSLCTSTAA